MNLNKIIRPFICIAFLLLGIKGSAQVSMLQKTINKLESYKNFSYQYVEKVQDFTNDTTIRLHKDIIQKAPGDNNFGYLFSLETQQPGNKYHAIDLYNGQNLFLIAPDDRTYEIRDIKKHGTVTTFYSLLTFLKWIKSRPEKKPPVMAPDTAINGAVCYHLVFDIYDTVINKEHCYSLANMFIDKHSGLVDAVILIERTNEFGNNITNIYNGYFYSDYKFNQDNIDIASMQIPAGYHLPKAEVNPPYLSPGTVAPGWTLHTTDGKQLSLAQLKGKVVMIDCFFIGCGACMESLASVDSIYEKYKGRDFVLVSISTRDKTASLVSFKKTYHIKSPVCGDAADMINSYRIYSAPVFYFISKDGKIANVVEGFSPDFVTKTTTIIDGLLNK
ncbi:MAG: redoxin domain-containing protein [Mucilaginibacter sp.]